MWKKTYSNANEEAEIITLTKSMMLRLEMNAYNKEAVPAWMSLIKSKNSCTFYIDPKGTQEQILAIEELGFEWTDEQIIPSDAERVFQTHEE